MRTRTAAVALVLLALLGSVAVVDFGGDLTIDEQWVSDTARENRVNHHAAAIGPDGSVVAPIAAVIDTEPIGPTSCSLVRLTPADGAVEWRAPVPAENCTTHAITAPVIGDADDDSGTEAAVVTTERALIVRDLADGSEAWRVTLSTFGYGAPTVADFGDGGSVVAVDIRGTVVRASDGDVVWNATVDDTVWASPVVADVDDDATTEIVVVGSSAVVAFDEDGVVEWRAPAGGASVSVADVDEDSARELLVGNVTGVTVVDGRDGSVESRYALGGVTRVSAVVDRGDGRREVYAGISGGTVAALDPRTGTVRWRTQIADAEQITPAPQIADVTGDGTREVVAVANDGTVAVLDPETGEQLATYERDVPVWTPLSTGDLDDDGAAELIVRYGDGRVVRLDVNR